MGWKDEFQEAIIAFLVRESSPVTEEDPSYGWLARDWVELLGHLKACTVDAAKSFWSDSDWSEFAGTFADPPWEIRKGIDTKVYCSCGRIAGRIWRYTGSSAELLRAITDG